MPVPPPRPAAPGAPTAPQRPAPAIEPLVVRTTPAAGLAAPLAPAPIEPPSGPVGAPRAMGRPGGPPVAAPSPTGQPRPAPGVAAPNVPSQTGKSRAGARHPVPQHRVRSLRWADRRVRRLATQCRAPARRRRQPLARPHVQSDHPLQWVCRRVHRWAHPDRQPLQVVLRRVCRDPPFSPRAEQCYRRDPQRRRRRRRRPGPHHARPACRPLDLPLELPLDLPLHLRLPHRRAHRTFRRVPVARCRHDRQASRPLRLRTPPRRRARCRKRLPRRPPCRRALRPR